MRRSVGFVLCNTVAAAAIAAAMNGAMPVYPNGQSLNKGIPASPEGMAIPAVYETVDTVQTVDGWYQTNAPKACARSAASGGIKYACPGGSIMIYAHASKTQIAFVPAGSISR